MDNAVVAMLKVYDDSYSRYLYYKDGKTHLPGTTPENVADTIKLILYKQALADPNRKEITIQLRANGTSKQRSQMFFANAPRDVLCITAGGDPGSKRPSAWNAGS